MNRIILTALVLVLSAASVATAETHRLVFEGVRSEHKLALQDLGPDTPSEWSSFNYLVVEFRTSSPQRFDLYVDTQDGPRRIRIQPFGQRVWIRAAVPLRFLLHKDQKGYDLASITNKPTHSFWMGVIGPFGPLSAVRGLRIVMDYPLNTPVIEIRSLKLSKEDPGSDILDERPLIDEYGQWARADWPRKIKSLEQLKHDWTEEEKTFIPDGFDYDQYGGYLGTKAKATGFFRVEQIAGKWWFIDPDGHYFLSMAVPGMGAFGTGTPVDGREDYYAALPPPGLMPSQPPRTSAASDTAAKRASFRSWNLFRRYGPEWPVKANEMEVRRVKGWGLNTVSHYGRASEASPSGAQRTPFLVTLGDWQMEPANLGMPDVYSEGFARQVDAIAAARCEPVKNDPYLIGYFVGNEPPWPGRESELVDMFLSGPPNATQRVLHEFLAQGDTPERRREFVLSTFQKYLEIIGATVKRHDPNHLNLGIRFGGMPPDYVIRMARVFDVFSVNIYEYSPADLLKMFYRLADRPIIIGEFHFGVPADGLGAGLVQVSSQHERGVAYRYFVEQAAANPAFVGAAFFIGVDEPVTGRMDGENYNIGFLDVTDRAYPELVEAAKTTLKQLMEVHLGKVKPFDQRPKASEAGTSPTPWADEQHVKALKNGMTF